MSDLQTVVGTNGGITEKANGWFEVQVAIPGKNFPLKLATKKSEIIDSVRAVGESVSTFYYTEILSDKINPHNNEPYKNRYLESVEAGVSPGAEAAAAASSTASGSGSGGMTEEGWRAKERRDFRSRAWAQAISAMHHTIAVDEDPALIYARIKTLQTAIYRDIVRELDGDEAAQPPVPATASTDDYPHGDDDIPF